ncbi:MAG: glycosyltransferase family 39 protein [Chloroflexi bacterium]|nr:glycosyltransferase family 39 protein [Chloroflexota bacterium]
MQRFRPIVWVGIIALNATLMGHLLFALNTSPVDLRLRLSISIVVAFASALFALWRAFDPVPLLLGDTTHNLYTTATTVGLLILALVPVPPDPNAHLLQTHTLLTFVFTSGVIYQSLFDTASPPRNRQLWYLGTLIVLILLTLIRLYGLATYPAVDIQDEPWMTAWSAYWLKTGRYGDPTLLGFGDAYHVFPRFFWLHAAWIDLFGIGLWQGRVLSFLLIFPVIIFSGAAARNLYGMRVALMTTVTLFASAVLAAAARIRHDVGLAVVVACSLWLHTEAIKRGARPLHVLAGLMIGLGIYADYHAAAYGAALLVGLYVPGMVQRRRWDTNALWYASGLLISASVVLVVQALANDMAGWNSVWARLWSADRDPVDWALTFAGSIVSIGLASVFELLLLTISVIAAARRRHLRDTQLLTTLLIGHGLLALLVDDQLIYGLIPLTPIYGLIIGALSVQPDEVHAGLPFKRGQLVSFTMLLIPILGMTATRPVEAVLNRERIQPTTPIAVEWMLDHVPVEYSVAGDLYYYFWLNDYPFASHLLADYLSPENAARFPNAEAVWADFAPDYVIVDPAYPASYDQTFAPLLASEWFSAHYDIAVDFDDALSTAVIYRRTH